MREEVGEVVLRVRLDVPDRVLVFIVSAFKANQWELVTQPIAGQPAPIVVMTPPAGLDRPEMPENAIPLSRQVGYVLPMPEKEWTVAFQNFALIIRRTTSKGNLIEFAVVLVAFVSGKWVDITRYDTAHGTPHRDILGVNQGLRFKRWMDDIGFAEAFDYAIRDCTKNAENYLADLLAH